MLTKAAQYAIRATTYLVENSDAKHKINVKQIANELKIPTPFLAKLMQQLSKAKIISSTKGPGGGFYFSEENKKNTIWDVIVSIDGVHRFSECFLGLPDCNNENPCAFHDIVVSFKTKLIKELSQNHFSPMDTPNKVEL